MANNPCGSDIPVRVPGDPGHIADHNKLHCFFDNPKVLNSNVFWAAVKQGGGLVDQASVQFPRSVSSGHVASSEVTLVLDVDSFLICFYGEWGAVDDTFHLENMTWLIQRVADDTGAIVIEDPWIAQVSALTPVSYVAGTSTLQPVAFTSISPDDSNFISVTNTATQVTVQTLGLYRMVIQTSITF